MIKKAITLLIGSAFILISTLSIFFIKISEEIPSYKEIKNIQLETPLAIYSKEGILISEFGEKKRIMLDIDEIPKQIINAFISTEDTRFYHHLGVDPIGIMRALAVLIATGKKSQGASTITMQVARNIFLSKEKTYSRKIREIILALKIEKVLSKREIMELYINRSFFGYRAYGVGAAAEVYYGKEVHELSIAEIAMIAGLPKSPSTINPIINPEKGRKRRNIVLSNMLDQGFITQDEYNEAVQVDPRTEIHVKDTDLKAPYVAEIARKFLVSKIGEKEAYTGGYSIYTTISADIQKYANSSLHENVIKYDKRHGYRGAVDNKPLQYKNKQLDVKSAIESMKNIKRHEHMQVAIVTKVNKKSAEILTYRKKTGTINWKGMSWAREFIDDKRQGKNPKVAADILKEGDIIYVTTQKKETDEYNLSQIPEVSSALVSIDPNSGAIQSLVGGFSFADSQYNGATQASRQLGSNIKPFIYAAALEKDYTLATIINNSPIQTWDASQDINWRPKNSPDIYTGPTRLKMGLACSINIVSIKVMRLVGVDEAIKELGKFGFNEEQYPRNESIALGSGSTTPLEAVRAFSVFANGGFLIEPFLIQRITDKNGKVVMESNPKVACKECERAQRRSDPIIPEDNHFCYRNNENTAVRVIRESIAFLITSALRSAIWGSGVRRDGSYWRGTGWRAKDIGRRDLSGKSGTSNLSRDTWFSGFTSGLATTVWMGFDDNQRTLGYTTENKNYKQEIHGAESGAKTAGPIWNDFMRQALKHFPEQDASIPDDIISITIDKDTGLPVDKRSKKSLEEYFIKGTEPKEENYEDEKTSINTYDYIF